ncbi:glucan endo-1,3-beta-glucosidase [Klebsormidium nitens]|uniref:Glucan endo-1,3-beta-glucosidase n=1 Tax=Klebsormidium nitens TaxID=105231 RepID=A0A1Y1IJF6_KLENI|nr:glucan endo-1,3-beta-glucosidase [Klebsormidium nitens]|eukprot:GAQ88757.1 glucan endo-1,3-beta-glucosidase [Klebsormidium nitens]
MAGRKYCFLMDTLQSQLFCIFFFASGLFLGGTWTADAANSTALANTTLALNITANSSTPSGRSNSTASVGANYVGVNWGVLSSQPLPGNVTVRILQDAGFTSVKFFSAPPEYLRALANTSIEVQVLMPLDQVMNVSSYNQSLALAHTNALAWVDANVVLWIRQGVNITSLAVGNEPFVLGLNVTFGAYVMPAVRSVYFALQQRGLNDTVKLTVPMDAGSTFGNTYPPSVSEFQEPMKPILLDMLQFLAQTRSFLTLNLYPFVSLKYDNTIDIDFAVGRPGHGFTDQGYYYSDLLSAQIDATYIAMNKLYPQGAQNVSLQLGETGWPSAGGYGATLQNASDYLTYSVSPLAGGQGTPRYPNRTVKSYIFALFDEDLKYTIGIGDYELHWGLLYANGTSKYAGNSSSGVPAAAPSGALSNTTALAPSAANSTSRTGTWCIAVSSADSQQLTAGLNYACGPGGADCTAIQPGGPCYVQLGVANRVQSFASYAYNSYYQSHKLDPGACFFNNTAVLTRVDPSPNSSCQYPSS